MSSDVTASQAVGALRQLTRAVAVAASEEEAQRLRLGIVALFRATEGPGDDGDVAALVDVLVGAAGRES